MLKNSCFSKVSENLAYGWILFAKLMNLFPNKQPVDAIEIGTNQIEFFRWA